MEFNALIELDVHVDPLTDTEIGRILDPVLPHHGCVARSAKGRVQLIVTIDAVDAIHALRFVHELTSTAYANHRVACVDILPTVAYDVHTGAVGDFR